MEAHKSSKTLSTAAVIAAIYAAVTLLLSPFSYGIMQIRVSEALTALAMFTPAAIPGLTIGCFFANFLGPNGIVDAIAGSIATLVGACLTYKLRHRFFLAPLPMVVTNAIVIGPMLHYVYAVPVEPLYCILYVGIGEFISCYGFGLPLAKILQKRRGDIGL